MLNYANPSRFMTIRLIHFYANLKHNKQARTDCVPILDSENLSHLRQNSFALYVCMLQEQFWLQGRPFLLAPIPTQWEAAVPIASTAAPACPGPAIWVLLGTTGAVVCPRLTHPAAPSALQLISPATPAAPHTFQPCAHLFCLPARTLEGPDRNLLTMLFRLPPNSQHLHALPHSAIATKAVYSLCSHLPSHSFIVSAIFRFSLQFRGLMLASQPQLSFLQPQKG